MGFLSLLTSYKVFWDIMVDGLVGGFVVVFR